MARPTIYSQEIIDKSKDYINKAQKNEFGYPSIAELALTLDISRSTLYLWQKEHEEFSDIIERVLLLQELQLTTNGLAGKYNPTITKLLLTKHGYSDKQELTGKDGEKLELGVVILPSKNESSLETPAETGNSPQSN